MKITSRGKALLKWSQIKGDMTIDEPIIKLTVLDGKIQFLIEFSEFEKGRLLKWLLEDKKAIEFCRRNKCTNQLI